MKEDHDRIANVCQNYMVDLVQEDGFFISHSCLPVSDNHVVTNIQKSLATANLFVRGSTEKKDMPKRLWIPARSAWEIREHRSSLTY